MINQALYENSALMMACIQARHTAIWKENFPARDTFFSRRSKNPGKAKSSLCEKGWRNLRQRGTNCKSLEPEVPEEHLSGLD